MLGASEGGLASAERLGAPSEPAEGAVAGPGGVLLASAGGEGGAGCASRGCGGDG